MANGITHFFAHSGTQSDPVLETDAAMAAEVRDRMHEVDIEVMIDQIPGEPSVMVCVMVCCVLEGGLQVFLVLH